MLTQASAAELAARLKAREVSAVEVLEAHLERIDRHDPDLGAFLYVDREAAYRDARRCQEALDRREGGPLTGVPVAHKDNLSTAGSPTTCASRILEGFVPPYDATVVERARSHGLVSVGKTNLDEFAMGTSCENSAFQVTRNPWDPDCSPGGSSGGSAVAVAAEMCPVALGSDTGGSVRMPAALCGIVGYKPSYGRVSRYGLIAFASSLDQVGTFGRTVEDAALAAEAVSGHDPRDSTSAILPPVSSQGVKSGTLKGTRFGLPEEMFSEAVEPDVRECLERAVESLVKEGAEVKRLSLPSTSLGVSTYYLIAPAEASSNLARFDGVRFGPTVGGDGHAGNSARTRGTLFGHEVKLRIMVGTYALSAGYYDAYYLKAQQARALMVAEFDQAFQDVDVLVSPTSPTVAFRLGALRDDPLALKLLDRCTVPANLGGYPSLSLPCGFARNLPVGLCLTGPVNRDEDLLRTAHAVERALPWGYRRPPMP
ncbi:MAG: Asp-tRNA(Asn)/Glu-tRNA(Gln) amidotransferase subunit GatA [Armatimonadetes bacterium]|nr:Asp-tRNA(Asn)/Glu-tRNA(Gln) amidotransferase subunit GatA [Armatimonadota bacterium]